MIRRLNGDQLHPVGYRDGAELIKTWCGPLDECGVWEEIAPKLTRIVDDLEM